MLCWQTPVEDVPLAIAPFQGRVLVGVGKLLRIYDLGKKKLLRKCENKVSRQIEALTLDCVLGRKWELSSDWEHIQMNVYTVYSHFALWFLNHFASLNKSNYLFAKECKSFQKEKYNLYLKSCELRFAGNSNPSSYSIWGSGPCRLVYTNKGSFYSRRLELYQDFENPQLCIETGTALTKLQYSTNYSVQSCHVIASAINSYLHTKYQVNII